MSSGRQVLPVVPRPSVGVQERTGEEGGIGHPAGDDHVGAVIQCLHDPLAPEIGVGRDRIGHVQQIEHVVTEQDAILSRRDAARRDLGDDVRRAAGIRGTGVRDDADTPGPAAGQHRGHPLTEEGIEPRARIPPALELTQRDGALRQALEHQEVELAPFHELDRRFDPVVGEAGTGTDPHTPGHPSMIHPR